MMRRSAKFFDIFAACVRVFDKQRRRSYDLQMLIAGELAT